MAVIPGFGLLDRVLAGACAILANPNSPIWADQVNKFESFIGGEGAISNGPALGKLAALFGLIYIYTRSITIALCFVLAFMLIDLVP